MMKKNGFTLIELIIAIGLAAILLPAIVAVFSFSLFAAGQGESFSKAHTLAQEQMEAAYYLRGQDETIWDWDNPNLNTDTGFYYQPYKEVGGWVIGSKTDTPLDSDLDGFIKTIRVEPACRDILNALVDCSIGISDSSSRKIIVKVSWNEKGGGQDVKLESYVTRH